MYERDVVVGRLFPYTLINRLCFSCCTSFPYTLDTPYIYAVIDNSFVVISPFGIELGRGDAQKALSILKENLPDNIAPVVNGTADELIF